MFNTVKNTAVARGNCSPQVLPVKRPGRKSWKDRLNEAIQVHLDINYSALEIRERIKRSLIRKKAAANKAEQLTFDLFRRISAHSGIPTEELQKDREFVLDRNKPENIELALEKFEKFIKFMAFKFLWSGIGLDDLAQRGRIGVWEAFEDFKVERECSFFTFAINKIRWSMLNLMRDCHRHKALSLDEEIDETGALIHEVIPAPEPRMSIYDSVLISEVWALVDRLPEKSRRVLYLRFEEGLSLLNTGKLLGFSKQHAEKEEKKAIELLKNIVLNAEGSEA